MTRKWRPLAAAVGALALVAIAGTFAHSRPGRLLRAYAPTAFGMHAHAPGLFVETHMDAAAADRIRRARAEAEQRLHHIFPSLKSTPTVLACATPECFRRFGGRGRGVNVGHRLVLSRRGLNATILAHEWCHVETNVRAGFFNALPAWFKEGLATVASGDPRFSQAVFRARVANGWHPPPLAEMVSLDDFLAADQGYLAAAHEVRHWLAAVGLSGLNDLLRNVHDGAPFESRYPRPWGHE
ncbi:MAG: hypothetical protein OXR73_22840 [Myxococcales bacterium]|nr:hypothetical protein [Myxococcales bacterium]